MDEIERLRNQLDRARNAHKLALNKWRERLGEAIARSKAAHDRLVNTHGEDAVADFPDAAGPLRTMIKIAEMFSADVDKEMPPATCVQCGKVVEWARVCFARPTCYACMPPPPPLETIT